MSIEKKLYTIEQIRCIQQEAIDQQVINARGLMLQAAKALLQRVQLSWPNAQHLLILCGKGHNGGDGLSFAKLAYQAGLSVQIVMLSDRSACSRLTQLALDECVALGLTIETHTSCMSFEADLIVDALLGIGLNGPVRPHYAKVIEWINTQSTPCLSVDVPSGLDADTGNIFNVCVRAQVTQTFVGHKRGLFTYRSTEYAGLIYLDTLSINYDSSNIKHSLNLVGLADSLDFLPRRQCDTHKDDFGHVLIIGGDYGMGGAIRLAAEAAMRSGASLVTVATRPEHLSVVNSCRSDMTCQRVESVSSIEGLSNKVDVVVIGPGLGKTAWGHDLLNAILAWDQPKVLDADALNIISANPDCRNDWVLTPHPGEAARLMGSSGDAIQHDRFQSIQSLQQRFGGVIALKGAGTLVANDQQMALCPFGNPGMVSGGMGDLLSGIIGGFIAQGLPMYEATLSAVLSHAKAVDFASAKDGDCGLLAVDVLNCLRRFVNSEIMAV